LNDDITVVVPAELSFSYAGRPITQAFTMKNPGPYRWNLVANIEGPGARDFQVEGCEILREGSECEWRVTFNPAYEKEVLREATLVITGSVERPQGTLSARIAPIPLRARTRDVPWRLGLAGDGGTVRNAQTPWEVPEFEIVAREGRKGTALVEVRNPLDRAIRLAVSKPQTTGGVDLFVGKDNCTARELPPRGSCSIEVIYGHTMSIQQSPGISSEITPGIAYGVIAVFEAGDTESDSDLRDRARIVVRGQRTSLSSLLPAAKGLSTTGWR
jgi:hypothetical protein